MPSYFYQEDAYDGGWHQLITAAAEHGISGAA